MIFGNAFQLIPDMALFVSVSPDERLQETSSLLRQLFSLPDFKTKTKLMGKVVRVSRGQLEYYDIHAHPIIRVPSWPG